MSTTNIPSLPFKGKLHQSAATIDELPVHPIGYIDTFILARDHPFNTNEIRTVQRSCREDCRRSCGGSCRGAFPVVAQGPTELPFRLKIQLLTRRKVAVLGLLELDDAAVARCDVALDFLVSTRDDAERLKTSFERHLIKNWHRSQNVVRYKHTCYSGPKRAGNVVVIYADRPSKVAAEGTPCVHVEWRVNGRAACRRAGVGTVADARDLDHREFWRQRLLLQRIDQQRLGSELAVSDTAVSHLLRIVRWDHHDEHGNFVLPDFCSQQLLDHYRGPEHRETSRKVRRSLIEVRNDPYLPPNPADMLYKQPINLINEITHPRDKDSRHRKPRSTTATAQAPPDSVHSLVRRSFFGLKTSG